MRGGGVDRKSGHLHICADSDSACRKNLDLLIQTPPFSDPSEGVQKLGQTRESCPVGEPWSCVSPRTLWWHRSTLVRSLFCRLELTITTHRGASSCLQALPSSMAPSNFNFSSVSNGVSLKWTKDPERNRPVVCCCSSCTFGAKTPTTDSHTSHRQK